MVFTALEAEFRLDTDLPVLSVSFLISKASFTPSLLAKSAPILPNCSVIERSARIEALSFVRGILKRTCNYPKLF